MNTEKKQWIAPQATEMEVNSGWHHAHTRETPYHSAPYDS